MTLLAQLHKIFVAIIMDDQDGHFSTCLADHCVVLVDMADTSSNSRALGQVNALLWSIAHAQFRDLKDRAQVDLSWLLTKASASLLKI